MPMPDALPAPDAPTHERVALEILDDRLNIVVIPGVAAVEDAGALRIYRDTEAREIARVPRTGIVEL